MARWYYSHVRRRVDRYGRWCGRRERRFDMNARDRITVAVRTRSRSVPSRQASSWFISDKSSLRVKAGLSGGQWNKHVARARQVRRAAFVQQSYPSRTGQITHPAQLFMQSVLQRRRLRAAAAEEAVIEYCTNDRQSTQPRQRLRKTRVDGNKLYVVTPHARDGRRRHEPGADRQQCPGWPRRARWWRPWSGKRLEGVDPDPPADRVGIPARDRLDGQRMLGA
jgi:hypothetical protein